MVNGFIAHAACRLPCSSWWMARNEPHPGQYQPVKYQTGQGGKIRDVAGSKTRSMTTTSVAVPNNAASNRRFRVSSKDSPI